MNVIAGTVGFVVVAIAAEVQQVEFVDEAVFFEEINGAIDGDQVDFVADFLRAFEYLIDIEVLLGCVHDLENNAALTSETDAALTESLLEMARGVSSVNAFA